MMPTNRPPADIGSLVCATVRTVEHLGRIVGQRGGNLIIARVTIEDGVERRIGRMLYVHPGRVWHVPDADELRVRADAARAAALAVKAQQGSPLKPNKEPAIREIDCQGFRLR